MKITTAVERVIPLAQSIHNYWETELPKRHPRYPIVAPGADDGPPPPEEKQLRHLLARLSEDTLYKLALIMYLGRGDFDTSDLPGGFQAIRANDTPSILISLMMDQAPLAEYLREGMAMLKSPGIDLDKLDLLAVKPGSSVTR